MVICSVLFIGLLGGLANARHIVCRYDDAAACLATEVDDIPWSSNGETPAPKPECMDGYAVYDDTDESDYGQPDSFSIKWMQKWVDIDDINGYYITAASSSGSSDYYTLTLDREKLPQYRDGETSFATFNFTVDGFRNGAIVVHALPMYAIDSTEYSLTLQIEYNEVVSKDSCPSSIKTVPSTTVPEEAEKIPKNGIEVMTSKTNLQTATKKTVQMVPLTITVLACILTSVGTVVLVLVLACLWVIICKVLEKPQRTKLAQLKHEQNTRKRGFSGKPAVFLMTSMAEGEYDDHNAEFYKIVALCLVDTLRNSNDYEVSCNLWMMKEISDCGVAVWAHNMIKSHKMFIALCNKSTVASIQQWLTIDSGDTKHLVQETDPSVHVICRLMRNISHQNKKLIIVCIEEDHHDCLAYLPLPGLENCSHFNLTYEFPEFINALNPKGQYLRGNKTTTMTKSFSEMLIKNRSRYQQSCFSNENAMRNDIFSQKYEKLPAEIPEPKHFCHIDETRLDESFQSFSKSKQRSRSSSSLEKVVTETQYDSVFSSRCNSHSTESLSSCDDTGFHENLDRKESHKMAHYQATGARPKVQKM